MKKLTTLLFNAIFAVISIAAIMFYFLFPMWTINLTYTVSKDEMNELLGSAIGEDYNFSGAIDDAGVPIAISLELDSFDQILSLSNGNEARVNRIIGRNADNIAAQLSGTIGDISRNVVKTVTATNVQKQITTQITSFLSTDDNPVSEEEAKEKLSQAGVTDQYIADQTDAIIDALYENGGSVESVSDDVIAAAEDIYTKLAESDVEEFSELELTEENRAELRGAVEDALNNIADENGQLDPETFVDSMLAEMLRSMNSDEQTEDSAPSGSDNSDEESAAAPTALLEAATKASGTESTETVTTGASSVSEELSSYLTRMLQQNGMDRMMGIALLVITILLLISLLSWLYLLIKIIVKCFSRNSYVKLKAPIILGWLPFLVLVLLPMLGIMIAQNILAIPALSAITLGVASSGMYAAIGALLLVLIWIPYRIICKPRA